MPICTVRLLLDKFLDRCHSWLIYVSAGTQLIRVQRLNYSATSFITTLTVYLSWPVVTKGLTANPWICTVPFKARHLSCHTINIIKAPRRLLTKRCLTFQHTYLNQVPHSGQLSSLCICVCSLCCSCCSISLTCQQTQHHVTSINLIICLPYYVLCAALA